MGVEPISPPWEGDELNRYSMEPKRPQASCQFFLPMKHFTFHENRQEFLHRNFQNKKPRLAAFSPRRIRTPTVRTRIWSATITQSGNEHLKVNNTILPHTFNHSFPLCWKTRNIKNIVVCLKIVKVSRAVFGVQNEKLWYMTHENCKNFLNKITSKIL